MTGQALTTAQAWDGPFWAAVAAGLGEPPYPSQPAEGGAWVATALGLWFVRDAVDPDGTGRFALHTLEPRDGGPPRTVAVIPGEPLVRIDEIPGFRRFALAVGLAVRPETLAALAVRLHGRRPAAQVLRDPAEVLAHLSPAHRIRLGDLVPFRPRMREDGAWQARFSAYEWLAGPAGGPATAVAVEDWEMRFVPQRTFTWAATPRGRPLALA